MKSRRQTTLSIVLSGEEPPSEFRIFTAGTVDTVKGQFTFDEQAATSVMKEYVAHGIDLMIDYDHASLSSNAPIPAEAGKAAGWFNLEVRNGELWAVNVRWTPAAAQALKSKEWRFMSPAFDTDESGRVSSLLNVAITNLPATRNLQPLMAANATTTLGDKGMTLEEMMSVAEALGLPADATLADFLAKIGDLTKPAEEPPAEEPPPAEMAADPEKDKPEEMVAAMKRVRALSGRKSTVETLADAEVWHASHIALESERQKLAADRAILESAKRRKGCADMVAAGVRTPAEVWADPLAESLAPKPYLLSMPIADFDALVADALKGGSKTKAPPSPSKDGKNADGSREFVTKHGPYTMSARELQKCADKKIDPAKYAENRLATLARSNSGAKAGA